MNPILRQYMVLAHRYVGLSIAVFLVLAGLTGSVLAFRDQLDPLLNPHLFVVPARTGTEQMLEPFALQQRVQQQLPDARVDQVVFHRTPGRSVTFWLNPRTDGATGKVIPLTTDQVFVDPYTGQIMGTRKWGAIFYEGAFHVEGLLPFLFEIHHALALPGPWGKWFMGVISLLWLLDCFVGFCLTLPARQKHGRALFLRWKPAWCIKLPASAYRLNVDLHRAVALWLWGALLLFAFSSAMLNLRKEVYLPLMSVAFTFSQPPSATPGRPLGQRDPVLDWHAAAAIGRAETEKLAARYRFGVKYEDALYLARRRGVYVYRTHSTADVRDAGQGSGTAVIFDADTGAVYHTEVERGRASGDAISAWVQALHMATVFGWPYRIFVGCLGMAVVMLSTTGVIIWWKKRRARKRGGGPGNR